MTVNHESRLVEFPNFYVLELDVKKHFHFVLLSGLPHQHEAQMVAHKHHLLGQAAMLAACQRTVLKLHGLTHLPLLADRLKLLDVAQLQVNVVGHEATAVSVAVAQLAHTVKGDQQLPQVLFFDELILISKQQRRSPAEHLDGVFEGGLNFGDQHRTHPALND